MTLHGHSERLNAERILILSGILCVLLAMVLGYLYASYVSHVANAAAKQAWAQVMTAIAQLDTENVKQQFAIIAEMTDRRGRIMNSHSHLGASGLLALLLAVLQPLSSLSTNVKRNLAWGVLLGVILQFAGVVSSYYLAANTIYLSDLGGLLLIAGFAGTLYGLLRQPESERPNLTSLAKEALHTGSSQLLLKGAVTLILLCIALGVLLAWIMVSGTEAESLAAVSQSAIELMQQDVQAAQAAIAKFKATQTKMAINAAAHSHGIEMALVMLMVALLRNNIHYSESFFKPWSIGFVVFSFMFPVWILTANNYNMIFAKFANYTGVTLAVLLLIAGIGTLRQNSSRPATDVATEEL